MYKEKIEKIKKHLKEHKETYIAASAALIVGAIGGAMFVQKRYGTIGSDVLTPQLVVNGGKHVNTTITQQTISIYGNKIGHPGNPVYDMTTGKRFESETLAAKFLDVNHQTMRRHLDGKIPDLNGHMFARVAD